MKKTFRILAATFLVTLSAASIAFASPMDYPVPSESWTPPDNSREKQAIAETVKMQTHLSALVSEILDTKIGS